MIKTTTYCFIILLLLMFSCSKKNLKEENNHTLLELINTRLEVAPLVAKSKWNTKKPINDSVREKIILDSVKVKAQKLGIDKQFARDFFKAQFKAGKMVQIELHEKWTKDSQPPFIPNPDLTTEVRPVLDSLTPLLLLELRKIQQTNGRSLEKLKNSARKVINTNFNDSVIKTAISPIELYLQKNSITY